MDTSRQRIRAAIISTGLVLVLTAALTAETITGTIPAHWPDGIEAAVAIPLPLGLSMMDFDSAEITIDGSDKPLIVPAQVEHAYHAIGPLEYLWITWDPKPDDRGKRVTVKPIPATDQSMTASAYTARYDDPMLHVTTPDGQPILGYWHGKPEEGKRYLLTDFIHPVIGLDGETLTSSRAEDHLHHRGVFWPWLHYERHGQDIGSWWIPKNIRCDWGTIHSSDGPVLSRFEAQHFLVDKADGKRFIEQRVVCRVFKETQLGRAIDVEIMQQALEAGVKIGCTETKRKGYGGFCVRFAHAEDIQIVADGERLRVQDRNQVQAGWTDYTGRFVGADGKRSDKRSGAAVFVHGSHPEWPPFWITRRYGPMGIAWPGLKGMFELPTDKPLALRYRIWIHRDDAKQARVADHWSAYLTDWNWH